MKEQLLQSNAALFYRAKAQLGEGSIWDAATQKLYWVDIEGRHFNILNIQTVENISYNLTKRVGTVVPVDNHTILVALEDGLATVSLVTGEVSYKKQTNIHQTYNRRFNDGKCDPFGRLWVGTLSMDGVAKVSSLYCVNADFSLEEKIRDVSISNGIAWNSDGSAMYFADTPTRQITEYDFDLMTGNIIKKRIAVSIPDGMGYPDGMSIDSEGMLWIALWDGFGVARYDPHTGRLLQKINVPAPKVTSCAFGGPDLDILFITTATVEMTDDELQQYPLSGSIFSAVVKVKGVPAYKFAMS